MWHWQCLFCLLFPPFIFLSWRLITSQHCSGFCHTLTWISHGFTCVPHPDPPSHLPLYPILLGSCKKNYPPSFPYSFSFLNFHIHYQQHQLLLTPQYIPIHQFLSISATTMHSKSPPLLPGHTDLLSLLLFATVHSLHGSQVHNFKI